jgi:DDE superfamily endonuclease/Helix-turn-helix of DDE superfamily endonuclease
MILCYGRLTGHPAVFKSMTGLSVAEFDTLAEDLVPLLIAAVTAERDRPRRERAPGGGHPFDREHRDQLLLTVVWLRHDPILAVLGYLFGVSKSTASRIVPRVLPVLEQAGRDTRRMPEPGRQRRKKLADLRADTPGLAVLIDRFEQPIERPRDRAQADTFYSGKKKRHTLKVQVAVDEETGRFVDVSASFPGPTSDLSVLKSSGVLDRLPTGVGAVGDLAYVGMDKLSPGVEGAAPRRKPRGKPRPAEDIAYNREFSRRRVKVEHSSGRMRRFKAVAEVDRHHQRDHTRRVKAVAGLVNRQLRDGAAC